MSCRRPPFSLLCSGPNEVILRIMCVDIEDTSTIWDTACPCFGLFARFETISDALGASFPLDQDAALASASVSRLGCAHPELVVGPGLQKCPAFLNPALRMSRPSPYSRYQRLRRAPPRRWLSRFPFLSGDVFPMSRAGSLP